MAALALADKIGEANISCEPRDTDRYGRTVAVCRKGDEDLNAWLVSQGYATAYQRYSRDYVQAEDQPGRRSAVSGPARSTSRRDWRRAKRANGIETRPEMGSLQPRLPVPEQAACTIKGNISRKGDKVYHLPGSRDYERTVIEEASGERMFCSEDEAKAAGWRAPRR